MPELENVTFDEINISDKCHYKKKMTEKDLVLFSATSGDVNPVHLDKEFAANSVFKERIAHGMWSASLVSATLATVMPGPGTIYLSQTIEFHRPVKLEDELEVTLIVKSKDDTKKTVIYSLLPLFITIIVLIFFDNYISIFIYMSLLGFTMGISAPFIGALWAELYGLENLGSIKGLLHASMVFASALSPVIFGLIIDIGDWVFTEVCRLLRDWYDLNLFPPHFERIAVNISPVQFERHDFIRKIQQCIKETGVPVNHLEIELTECSLQASSDSVIEKLTAIQEMGINIAIDDFGTGYSSLSRLKEFPINVLKIDRSFVTDICSSQSDVAIVKAITSMSNALGIDSLAEGIETIEQANMLKKLQCQYGQGFLFSKPVNTLKFEALLSTEAAETIV